MVFYAVFWLLAAVLFILLVKGGAHKKVEKKVNEFKEIIENNDENEKGNV